ncbi:MAG TPA: rod shape-determining protein MreC [Roseiflexaceae bacterium]|nr:rod shape-determining protein MreC [Roseiflexaceae bacterium]
MRDSLRNRPIKLPRASPYRSLTLVVALVLLALLLVVLDQAGMLGSTRAQIQTLLTPIMRALRQVGDGVNGVGQGLTEVTQLRDRVAALEAENSQLKASDLQIQALQLQLARLEAQLRIEKEKPWKLLGADISGRTPDGGRRLVMLAAGSQQGVKPGMPVIGREGSSPPSLIGVVETVGPRSASVLLITDFSSAVSAQVYQKDKIATGVVQGQWQVGSRLKLEGVERADPLVSGDVVVTAGLTARMDTALPRAAIPKDIPIGIVESIKVDGHSQFADIRPYVDPDRVSYAWVLLSQDE